jgi:hypothetical protein
MALKNKAFLEFYADAIVKLPERMVDPKEKKRETND